ncbi:HBL159Wp [Eremothecium sinecaudum]|uniref:HBL159Wp n=1 Tax=Eremothecium sinecaudum TaxID=45286 RepID=A0A109UWF3_9SACH|nr:HBL159Wp [Eremothecium sinecaudum]AMD18743.1 HBL159Wp [Eremothecium sinecaudum]
MSLRSVLKLSFYLFVISSYKTLPGAYFIRFSYYLAKNVVIPMLTHRKGEATANIKRLRKDEYAAFGHTVLKTYCSPFEWDFYLHKNNSSYFEDLDIARTDLITKLFQKLFIDSYSWPYTPVANVFTSYSKQISPFQRYQIRSNILCWDEKWIYVISKFIINENEECSISITKYVLKDGRKTIKPREALEFCEIYNEKVENISRRNLKILSEESGFHDITQLAGLQHIYSEI